MKKFCFIIIAFFIAILNIKAEERTNYIKGSKIYINDTQSTRLNDNNYNTFVNINSNDIIKITSEEEFDNIYIIYYLNAQTGTLKYNENELSIGENNFLHEYVNISEKTNEVIINFDETVKIKEIFLFNGDVPSWVQVWNPPHEDADIILFSTHSDDEQLFFAGLIPKMVADGKKMQVIYFTNHNDNPARLDEQLNGLWAAGLRNYPVLGLIPDAYSTNLKGAIANMQAKGYTLDDTIKFEVDMMRRFKPEVVVGHDEAGEYGHGQHILNTHVLKEALKVVDDPTFEANYEPFLPYKVYLHLYKESQIVMNYDIPLDYFDGKTAYEMSKLGYKEHLSQQYTWFTKWLTGVNSSNQGTPYNLATEIKAVKSPITGVVSTFSPLEYGLYYSTVGYENVDNDMFYNIPQEVVIKEKEETVSSNDIEIESEHEVQSFKLTDYYYLLIFPTITIILTVILIILLKKRKRKAN